MSSNLPIGPVNFHFLPGQKECPAIPKKGIYTIPNHENSFISDPTAFIESHKHFLQKAKKLTSNLFSQIKTNPPPKTSRSQWKEKCRLLQIILQTHRL